MGLKNNTTLKLLVLFIIMSFLPLQLAQSATNVGTLNSSQATQPTIDGKITDAEWSTAQELDITMYFQDLLGPISMVFTMMSTYDVAAGTVSFALTIPDATQDPSDALYIIFKTNAAEDLIILDPSFAFGSDHDLKGFSPDQNITVDAISTPSIPILDTTAGGTDDGSGKCRHDSGQYTIELVFPLASNDTLGKDFNLTVGSQIDFSIFYTKDGTAYFQLETLADYDYCTLYLLPRTNFFGIGTFTLVASLLSTMLVVIVIRRKRN